MAIRQKTVIKLKVSGHSPSHARTDVSVRDLNVIIDEPIERGGTNLGASPTEFAYTSLMGCTTSIGNKCAHALGVEIGELDYAMEVEFDRRGVLLQAEVDVPFPAIRLEVTAHGSATQEELDKVATETAKYCAISKLFEAAGTKVEVNWRKA
ncbi:OsmC family protein [Shimia sp.]|uniref:OsmC family protein n=1 Tax=Shimia sp. TaxID=1954381 RepID=UPI003299CC66